MSEWRKIRANGLPDEGQSPKPGHRMAAEGIPFPWRWNGSTISTDLDVIWGMSGETAETIMNRTPIAKVYTTQLRHHADQVWYWLLSDEEFHRTIDELGDTEKYTTEVMPNNKYSARLHRKIKDIKKFQEFHHQLMGTSKNGAVGVKLDVSRGFPDSGQA